MIKLTVNAVLTVTVGDVTCLLFDQQTRSPAVMAMQRSAEQ